MLIVFLEACKDTYVRSCTPAPKTPASEVVVKTVNTVLATTGGTDMTSWVVVGLVAIATGLLFLYNHLNRKGRRDNDH